MKSILKTVLVLVLCFTLTSCIVSTAVGVVKTAAKVGYKVVKGTVNGVSWAVKKAQGKIDEDRLDGKWKIVGLYNGSYDTFASDENPDNTYKNSCIGSEEIFEFKTKRSKFKPAHCKSQDEEWVSYKYKYGKNPQSSEKENYIEYNSRNYISVIDVTNKTLVLEGTLNLGDSFGGKQLIMLEKTK
ncbi:hypothetical protein ACX3PU_09805 [Chryseobacterium sp. A301]